MSYKDILVYLDDSKACESRIEAAVALAKRQDARVSGVALALKSTISTYIGVDIPSSLTDAQQEIVVKSAKSAVAKLEEAATEADVDYDTHIIECGATKAPARLSFFARHSDICFMGQPNPDEPGVSFKNSLLESVLFNSARPVYIVPYIGRPQMKIRKAVVAWDGSKKVVRAVNDAIPLLRGRSEVIILVINPESRRGTHGSKPGSDIAAHLGRHGIKTKIDIQSHVNVAVDTIILNYLSDSGADLLIMGAYGHSRLREKAFGGVTNTIMHQMTTPVLMSE